MPRYQPTAKELLAIQADVAKEAGKDEALGDNLLFRALYHHKTGLFPRTGKPALWVREGEDWTRYKRNLSRREWIEQFFPIRDKGSKIHRMILNPAQRALLVTIIRLERAGMPVRVQILKARQQGFCYSPDMRVLTSDMRWVAIGEIGVGQEIVAVDEDPPKGQGGARRMRRGVVEAKRTIVEQAFRITMEDGRELIATAGHRHLCRLRTSTATVWRSVGDMQVGDCIRSLTPPWAESTPEDGWFGGLLDGEGSMRQKPRGGFEMSMSQCPGPVLDRARKYLVDAGVTVREDLDIRCGSGSSKIGKKAVGRLYVSRTSDAFKVLGKCRPTRFLGQDWWEGHKLPQKQDAWIKVLRIEPIGRRKMIDLQTSTKTFIAEGFVSHNSTFVQATLFEMLMRGEDVRGLIVAHNQDTSSILLAIAEIGLTRMVKREGARTEHWGFKMRSKAKSAIEFNQPLFGLIQITSAKTLGAGVGGTRTLVHYSEGSRYENAGEVYGSVMPSLPDMPGTYGFDESTAYGVGNKFHDDFWASWNQRDIPIRERSGWIARFFAWWQHPEYAWTRTFGHGKTLPVSTIQAIEATLDEEEEWVLKQRWFRRWEPGDEWVQEERRETPALVFAPDGSISHTHPTRAGMRNGKLVWKRRGVGWRTVSIDQLAWRREKMLDKAYRDDPSIFDQDYPSRPELAFRSTGDPMFDQKRLERYETACTAPIFHGFIMRREGTPTTGEPAKDAIVRVSNVRGGLKVWAWPEPGRQYILTADTAGGSKRGDKAAGVVLDGETGNLVAGWVERCDPHLWGPKMALLGWLYNEAMLGFETLPSAHGLAAAIEARAAGYPRSYHRVQYDSAQKRRTETLGFHTSVATKPLIISEIRQAMEAECLIPWIELVVEMKGQKRDETGLMTSNGNDDMVMAYGICHMIRRDCYHRGLIKLPVPVPVTDAERYWASEQRRIDRAEQRRGQSIRSRPPRWMH